MLAHFYACSINFLCQGKCDPSHEEYLDMIEECPFTCSDGECPGLAGNDVCEDTSFNCPRDEYLVKTCMQCYLCFS